MGNNGQWTMDRGRGEVRSDRKLLALALGKGFWMRAWHGFKRRLGRILQR